MLARVYSHLNQSTSYLSDVLQKKGSAVSERARGNGLKIAKEPANVSA
jgi:hypothetical protein